MRKSRFSRGDLRRGAGKAVGHLRRRKAILEDHLTVIWNCR